MVFKMVCPKRVSCQLNYMQPLSLVFLYLEKLLDFLFPTECVVCGTPGPDLCESCTADFGWPKPRRKRDRWKTSLWNYRDGNVERLVRHIKSRPNRRVAAAVARIFSERILNRPADPGSWVVVPVPVSGRRMRERGYNQSELIARPVADAFGFRMERGALVKFRHTAKQGTSKSREERETNVAGSFAVGNANAVAGMSVILIDDVTTTGSTLSEARKTLLAAGARSVMAWTVAN